MMEREHDRVELYSKSVRAGKRTYFFDVKQTNKGINYLIITESKKKFREDGTFFFEKNKIFLYQQDFNKFSLGLEEVVAFMNENHPAPELPEYNPEYRQPQDEGNIINLDDLENI